MSSLIKHTKDFFIITFISFALLILLELGLRVTSKNEVIQDIPFQYHPSYLVQLKPGYKGTFIRTSEAILDTIHWQVNSDGFRGKSLDSSSSKIIVYGDSNIQARFSKLEHTFPKKLEYYINKSGTQNFEVINAGIIGAGPDQNLLRMQIDIKKLKPQIIIFHIFADNDYGDLLRNRLFDLDANENLVSTKHEITIDQELQPSASNFIAKTEIAKKIKKITRRLSKNKPISTNRKESIEQLTSTCEKEFNTYKNGQKRKFSHFADHYDFDIATNPTGASSKVKINLMNEVIKKAADTAAKQGIKFMVLIQPAAFDVTQKFMLNFENLKEFRDYKATNLTSPIEIACRENNIHYVNLFDPFLQNQPDSLYFFDMHWSDKGQDLAAKEVQYFISRNILN